MSGKQNWQLKILFYNGLTTSLDLANQYTQEEMDIMATSHKDALLSGSGGFMSILVRAGGHAYYRYKDIMGLEFLFLGFSQ